MQGNIKREHYNPYHYYYLLLLFTTYIYTHYLIKINLSAKHIKQLMQLKEVFNIKTLYIIKMNNYFENI